MINGIERWKCMSEIFDRFHIFESVVGRDLDDGTLPDHENVLRVELAEHPQRRVGHHNLQKKMVTLIGHTVQWAPLNGITDNGIN
jgi:hypothetical protein